MDRLRRIVSNFGFLLQVTGLLLFLPIAIGLQAGELAAVSSLVATCFLSFGVGFIFNSFAERKEMDARTSLWLMLSAFTILPLVLMVPYIWNNVFHSGNPFDLFSNAYFETVSGFTTTGFSFIANPSSLPMSLLFYRSLVEFIGGVGFVYILVAFLYPSESLNDFSEAFGIEKIGDNLKKVFVAILLIYTLFVVVFTAIFYFVYSKNIIVSSCTAIDILTGGYQPNITAGIGIFQISILVLMLLGSLNFSFHYNLFRLKLHELLTPEIKFYLEFLAAMTVIISFLAWINPFDSLFHVVSMASSTGIEYIDIATTPVAAKILFILVGIAGGCAFSMAGGIKMKRIHQLVNALRRNSEEPTREELKSILVFIISFVVLLLLLSLAFSTVGISYLDSVFEVSSALTTNGVSMGITTITLPLAYKWILIFAMIVGRVEIVNIFKMIRG
ncbi:MAG: potassium transporter TrkG [Candidatus Bathyarchaeia archaeon]